MNKLLSISINTFNRYPFLKKNLELLINQIIKHKLQKEIEIFIGDDKSSDQTPILIKELSKKHSFIRYYINKENLGLPANSFKMIQKTKSEYIWMLSDDDYLIEGNLKSIVENIKKYKPNVYFLNHQAAIVDEKLNFKKSKTFLLPGIKENFTLLHTKKDFFNFLANQGLYGLRILLAQQSLFIQKTKNPQKNYQSIKKIYDTKKEFYPVCLSLYFNLPEKNYLIDTKNKLWLITNNRGWNATPKKALKVVVDYFDPMQKMILKKYSKEISFKLKILFIISIIYSKIAYFIAYVFDLFKINLILDKFIFGKGAKKIKIKEN